MLVLLPLEIAFGLLEHLSGWVNALLPAVGGLTYKSPIKVALKTSVKSIEGAVSVFTSNETAQAIVLIALSVVVIFLALSLIVKVMRKLVVGKMQVLLQRALSRGPFGKLSAITLGAGVTVAVQSSSITTSLMVPLAGANLLRLWQIFPVTVGANIGTTVTALLASLAISGPGADAARQIAIVHLIFNLLAMVIFYVPSVTRRWPMWAAQRLARVASRNRAIIALAYVVSLFYGVPAALVFLFN